MKTVPPLRSGGCAFGWRGLATSCLKCESLHYSSFLAFNMSSSSSSVRPSAKQQRRLLTSAEKERNRQARETRWRNVREQYHRHLDEKDNREAKLPDYNPKIYISNTQSAADGTVKDVIFKIQDGDPEDPEFFERTITGFQSAATGLIASELRKMMSTRTPQLKFQLRLSVEMRKYDENRRSVDVEPSWFLVSNNLAIRQPEDVTVELDFAFKQIQEQLDDYNRNGSNWVLHRINSCHLLVSRWVAMRAGSYIPLPEWLEKKRAIINIQNEDEYCFKYAIEAGYSLPKKNPQRVSHYTNRNTFRYKSDVSFPFTGQHKSLADFERMNSHLNISLNAYYASSSAQHPEHIAVLYQSQAPVINKQTKCIDLLLIEEEDEDGEPKRHWTLIKSFARLFSFGHHDVTCCRRCLVRMKTASLDSHMKSCSGKAEVKVSQPDPVEAFAGFKNYNKMLEAPFAIYADFEAIATSDKKAAAMSDKKSVIRTHIPNAFCFFRVCNFDSKHNGKPVLYRTNKERVQVDENGRLESDVGDKLIEELKVERDTIFGILKKAMIEGREMKLTDEDEEKFQAAEECHICQLPFINGVHPSWNNIEVDSVKVRDHDHLKMNSDRTSNFRGAAHAWCNLQFNIGFKIVDPDEENAEEEKEAKEDPNCMDSAYDDTSEEEEEQQQPTSKKKHKQHNLKLECRKFFIPVVFHNLKGYDGHIIIKAINSSTVTSRIECIPQNGERFLSMSFHNLRFIDSLQFLNSSLASLVDNIKKDNPDGFTYLKSQLNWICNRFNVEPTHERLQLLLSKGVYPYDYMDSFDRFDETCLPPIEKFKNLLDDSDLSQEDYTHAKVIWKAFKMKNIGDYHDLYLLTDVILLTDVFQRFRQDAIADCRLDPLHYLSLPGYSLDACYSQCPAVKGKAGLHHGECIQPFRVEVFNNSDPHRDMLSFCEDAIRGGISMITGRLGQANHKGLKDFDPDKPKRHIMYLDANNLYGWAMSQPMPIGEYKWLKNVSQFTTEHIMSLGDYDDYGYLLEVDLHIPPELHDKFKGYPLAPESRAVREEDVSPYTKQLRKRLAVKHDKTPKLLCTLEDKAEYKLHYRNLKLYLSLGYQLKKVHRVLKFRQEKWIAPYILQNTTKRAKATSDFSKDYFKLKNNAVFGKFLQDDRKHQNARFITKPWILERAIADPFFQDRYIVNEDTVIAYMGKKKLTMNKPIIVGVCILELSKLHMYKFYYEVMQKIFGQDSLRLLFTDTDSLCMEILTDDFHSEIVKNNAQCHFDWSNYPPSHPLYDSRGKAVLGLFKDECAGYHINQFVGLRSKLYSILKDEKTMLGELLEEGTSTIKVDKDKPAEAFKKAKHLEKKTAKGVKRWIIKKKLRHSQYYDCLTNPEYNPYNHLEQMVGFQTFNNQIYTTKISKMTLSAADDKLYLCDDGVTAWPYGYKGITIQTSSSSSSSSSHSPLPLAS